MVAFVRSHLLGLFLSLRPTFQYPPWRQTSLPTQQPILQFITTTPLAYKAMAQGNLERPQICPGLVRAQPQSYPESRNLQWRKAQAQPLQMGHQSHHEPSP